MAGRAGLRLDARLRPRDGHPRARGDRPAPPPQPRRDVVGGDEPAQAGLPLDGDDARDHLTAAVRDQGRGPLRLPRQGPRRPRPGARGRRPALGPVHDRPADRHRRGPHRARRVDLRAAPGRPPVRQRPGSHHPELPRQARHGDAAHRRPRSRGVRRRDRGLPDRARPEGPAAGAAQPGRPRGVRGAARRRRRRLGRGLAAHPGPRQPRASLALAGAAALDHRDGRLHPAGPAHRPPGVRPGRRALDRPPRLRPRRRPRRRRRPAARGRTAGRPALAGARRRLRDGRLGHGPHRPAHRGRHRGPHRGPPLRLRQRLRRLGLPQGGHRERDSPRRFRCTDHAKRNGNVSDYPGCSSPQGRREGPRQPHPTSTR